MKNIIIEGQIGTHLVGEIDTSYEELVKTFGEPNAENDGYKTDAEWVIYTPEGVATIYNYKDGINYNGKEDGTPTEEIRNWHIGGFDNRVVKYIERELHNEKILQKTSYLISSDSV